MTIEVSIVTPTFAKDRINDIKQLLDSVAVQNHGNVEMFLIVERSPDLSTSICQYIQEKNYSGIAVTCNNGPAGVSSARNSVLQETKGEIVAFVDDDAVLSCNWVEELVKTFKEDDSIIGVTGPIFPLWQNVDGSWFPQEFYWIFSCTYDKFPEKIEV
jgi:glucosyl-dolichyl phosphate glucuronosyltransferase